MSTYGGGEEGGAGYVIWAPKKDANPAYETTRASYMRRCVMPCRELGLEHHTAGIVCRCKERGGLR